MTDTFFGTKFRGEGSEFFFYGGSFFQQEREYSGVDWMDGLRFRKSISGHHFQTRRKLANNDFQYPREVIYNT